MRLCAGPCQGSLSLIRLIRVFRTRKRQLLPVTTRPSTPPPSKSFSTQRQPFLELLFASKPGLQRGGGVSRGYPLFGPRGPDRQTSTRDCVDPVLAWQTDSLCRHQTLRVRGARHAKNRGGWGEGTRCASEAHRGWCSAEGSPGLRGDRERYHSRPLLSHSGGPDHHMSPGPTCGPTLT